MTDFLKHAFELTKAQASVRVMNEEEMMSMVTALASKLKSMSEEAHLVELSAEPVFFLQRENDTENC